MSLRDSSARAAAAFLFAAALAHTTVAHAQTHSNKKFDPIAVLGSTGEKPDKKTKEYDDSGVVDTRPEPSESPPRRMVDECVLKSMQGVSSDVAARAIKSACEAKQVEAIKKERLAFNGEYGPSVKPDMLEVERWSVADGFVKIQIKNTDSRAGMMVTYVRLLVHGPSSRKGLGYCDGVLESFSLLLNLKSGSSKTAEVPLFYAASGGVPCHVEFDSARSKEASWAEGLKAVATPTVRPMPTDFLRPYTRRP